MHKENNIKRILIITNKWWECEPVINVLLHDKARPVKQLKYWPNIINHPKQRPNQDNLPAEDKNPKPRLIYSLEDKDIELWCISDLLEHLLDKPEYQSSSEKKYNYLSKIFNGIEPSFVIAAGTAGYPSETSINGCVVIGGQLFKHNCHPDGENPDSNFNIGPFDTLIESNINSDLYTSITTFDDIVTSKFILPPNLPAKKMNIFSDISYVSLGAVNVTKYSEYEAADKATLDSYKNLNLNYLPMSLETTHCIIKTKTNSPFIWVSGITDRVGYFSNEVSKNEYSQNFSASHNMGITIAWMIPKLLQFI